MSRRARVESAPAASLAERGFTSSYNERLFRKGVRKWLHEGRFRWLRRAMLRARLDRPLVVELGCFDGLALDYIPSFSAYYGYDAGWDDGILDARRLRSGENLHFVDCDNPAQFDPPQGFDAFVSLETLEHVPPAMLGGYLRKASGRMRPGGYAFISLPNEIGPLFVAKHVGKRLFLECNERYRPAEFLWQSFGLTDRVERDQHKGFDYRKMARELQAHFTLVRMEGVHAPALPNLFNPFVGLTLRKNGAAAGSIQ